MTLDWVARSLANRPGSLNLDSPRYNPRPPGVIRPGSGTDVVLMIFNKHPKQWFSFSNLEWHTKLSRQKISWALIYLQGRGDIVSSVGDDERSCRYFRYRLAKHGGNS
jgi:hypothetical protein